MNFPGSFRHIGDVEIAEIRKLATQLSPQQWAGYSLRQKRYEVHRDTQTIGLVYDPDFRHTHPTRLPALEVFQESLRPALKMASVFYEESPEGQALVNRFGLGYFVRATLVQLKAGGVIAPHRDNNFSLTHSHRIHLPVITNEHVLFTVGDDTMSLPAGGMYEINNRRTHSVENLSDEDRVHVILDFVLPGEKCCCGRKLHPRTLCSPQACAPTDRMHIPCTCFPEH
jgi:hypothetical protein